MPLFFAMATLSCAARLTAISATPTPSFEHACSTARGRGVAATSYRQFRTWTDRYVSITGAEPMTTTSAVDPIRLAFATSSYYYSREGDVGKGYAQALYDPRHRVLAICLQDDAWTALSLVANVSPPPFAVVRADLAGVATKHRIHLGSSVADVEAVYGRAALVRVPGRAPQLSYGRDIPLPKVDGYQETPEGVETWFAIANGRVVSISLGTGF